MVNLNIGLSKIFDKFTQAIFNKKYFGLTFSRPSIFVSCIIKTTFTVLKTTSVGSLFRGFLVYNQFNLN